VRTRRHPLSGALYDVRDDGLVEVVDRDGHWVSGELRWADPHLCGWLAGRQLPTGSAGATKDLPVGQRTPAGAR
jgi:hypothetical protein